MRAAHLAALQPIQGVERLRIVCTATESPDGIGGIEDHAACLEGTNRLDGVLAPWSLLQCFGRHVAMLC